MKAFLDTSSLLKLYHQESDTETLSTALETVKVFTNTSLSTKNTNKTIILTH